MPTSSQLDSAGGSEEPLPAISVVIPTFNRADVLGRCLDSVLGQTLPPFEVVLVDDGSTDETEQIVRERASELLRYIRVPSRAGAQAARNRGIREARGEWIAFQDSDDEWLPDKLERQVALLAERDFDPWTVVHGQGIVRQGIVREPESEPWRIPREPLEDGDVLDELLRRPATLLQAMLVSRAALERLGGLDEKVPSYHEWDTSIRLAHFCRFVGTTEPLFVYERGRADAISSSDLRDLRGWEYVIEKFRDEILERGGEEAWKQHARNLARRALGLGLWEEARRLLPLERRRDPRHWAYATCARLHVRPRSFRRMLTR